MKKFFVVVLVFCLLTSCNYNLKNNSAYKESAEYKNEKRGTLSYFYDICENKALYKALLSTILELEEKVNVACESYSELKNTITYVLNDNPQIFWVENKFSYKFVSKGEMQVNFEYSDTDTIIKEKISALEASAIDIIKNINPAWEKYKIGIAVHDLLIKNVIYEKESFHNQSYGAIVDKKATCQGYAKAYQLLLSYFDIESIIVLGQADEPHAWNCIKLDDNNYYYVDVTFDDVILADGFEFPSREFLFIDEQNLIKSHKPFIQALPNCDKMEYNYFIYESLVIKSPTKKEILNVIKKSAENAIANNEKFFQVKLNIDYNEIEYFENGVIDAAVGFYVKGYAKYKGRFYNQKSKVLTFALE